MLSVVSSYISAIREILSPTTASWPSRVLAARIRLRRIKELRWGSADIVRSVVDNDTPVKIDRVILKDKDRILIDITQLDPALVNCPVFTFTPSHGKPVATIVYLHGGGYVHQPGEKQWSACHRLVVNHHCRVVFPIYPKGPTYTYRDAYPPLLSLLNGISERYGEDYILMGDSAGGGLALGLVLALREQGKSRAMPKEVVVYSPWTDLTMSNPALMKQNYKDPWLNLVGLQEAVLMWTGLSTSSKSLDALEDPLVSPYFGDFTSGIPPISLSAGTRELFYPDLLLFWDKLLRESKGRSCRELVVGNEMLHVYGLVEQLPEAEPAWAMLVKAIERVRSFPKEKLAKL